MALLGWLVGKGSTPVDDWFQRGRASALGWLLFFTDQRTVAVLLLAAFAVATYQRRWRLAVVVALSPVVAVVFSRVFKEFFGRQMGGALAYPSGHTTVMVVVLGMVLLVVGARLYLTVVAICWLLLGMLGQSVTYHYFTDAVGGLLLGSAIVCGAVAVVGRRQKSRQETRTDQRDAPCAE